MKRYSSGLFILMALIAACGCQKKVESYTDDFTPEQLEIVEFVDSLSDISERPGFKDTFTKAPSSKVMGKFKKFKCSVITAEVSGNSATAEVEIGAYDGSEPVTKTWKFAKSGETWKIEDAPLP